MDSRLRGKDEKRRIPSNRPVPQRQKQVRIKKPAMLHEIVFPGSPGSRCIRPDRNLKHPATQEQPDDRGSMLGSRHHKKTQRIRFLTPTMDPRLRGQDEKRRVLSDRGHKEKIWRKPWLEFQNLGNQHILARCCWRNFLFLCQSPNATCRRRFMFLIKGSTKL